VSKTRPNRIPIKTQPSNAPTIHTTSQPTITHTHQTIHKSHTRWNSVIVHCVNPALLARTPKQLRTSNFAYWTTLCWFIRTPYFSFCLWEESESQRVKNARRTNAITHNAGRQVNAFQRALVKQPGTLVFGPIQRQPELRFSLAG